MNEVYNKKDTWIKSTISNSTKKIGQVVPQNSDFNEFTYIDIASIDNTKQKITKQNILKSSDAPSRARQVTLKDDIVFSTVRTYLKNVATVPDFKGVIISSTGFVVLRPNQKINRDFLF